MYFLCPIKYIFYTWIELNQFFFERAGRLADKPSNTTSIYSVLWPQYSIDFYFYMRARFPWWLFTWWWSLFLQYFVGQFIFCLYIFQEFVFHVYMLSTFLLDVYYVPFLQKKCISHELDNRFRQTFNYRTIYIWDGIYCTRTSISFALIRFDKVNWIIIFPKNQNRFLHFCLVLPHFL